MVWLRRYTEALRAGLSERDAAQFADSDQDIGWLRKLVEGHCPSDLIREIVT
jgi:hypothetical protein